MPTIDAMRLCNNILKRAFDQRVSLTPGQLQKTLYFVHCEYGFTTGQQLVTEPFEAWPSGPVNSWIYSYFRNHGTQTIDRYMRDSTDQALSLSEPHNPSITATLDRVFAATKNRSYNELKNISRTPQSAWWDAWQKYQRILDQEHIIADTTYRAPLGLYITRPL